MKKFMLQIETFFGQAYDWLSVAFSYELFSIVDKTPITLGRVIISLTAFFIGYRLIRALSNQVDRRILTHFDVEPAFRHSAKTYAFYIMMIFLILFVLKLLNIPLTAFTIVGGAFAVGLGLGAQNIIYDFLSGLVIMLEHPIRTGDVVELLDQKDVVRGHVEYIGARATRIYTVDNKHIIIPNNYFLSKSVLNWTLSDEVIRSDVQVGVIYGSPIEKVKELLAQAAGENEKVKKDPKPVILISDFGDNSIVFDLYFWAKIATVMDMKKIQSEIRFKINELFRQNNIVIAFPQRDLHLKSSTAPLQVEITKN
ncbi:MAG: mechanosensitive ion channel [Bdellovibrionales bacterium]|nr:mechanosensitive ion channel [Bdellovibrionales bacterium]